LVLHLPAHVPQLEALYLRRDAGIKVMGPRLFLITGKGGAGKSTAAGALALALSKQSRTVLVDLDQRYDAARLLGLEPEPARVSTPIENLELRSITAHSELANFIEGIVPIKAIARRLLKSQTFGHVTAALPGLDAFLMLERFRRLAVEARSQGAFVVVDGPASGTLVEVLSVPADLRRLAPWGTLNTMARQIEDFLSDPEGFALWLTARPEQFALQEALETVACLERSRIGSVAAILNAVPEPLLRPNDCAKIRSVRAHWRLAMKRQAISEMAAYARQQFELAGIKLLELPMLYTAEFGRAQMEILAAALADATG
jgi:energy-coupling factor transporter ATP-binding protein EcfA2